MKISQIRGVVLSNNQLKEVLGGGPTVPGGGSGPAACGTKCSVNANYKCATNAMGSCVCGGATADGGFSVGSCTN
jgi:hypothetical protein